MKKIFLAAFIALCGVGFVNANCIEICRNNFSSIDDCAKTCYEEIAQSPESPESAAPDINEQKILLDASTSRPHVEKLGPNL